MKQSIKTSLLYAHNLTSSLMGLKALNKEPRSTRVALLLFLLAIFAAAAFSLTVTAGGLNHSKVTTYARSPSPTRPR